MDIKKMIVVSIIAVAINMISVSAPQAGDVIHTGMSENELFKIYHEGNVQKYEKNGNKEVLVCDDILSPNPDDTITFYLVDGKVNSWDKNKVIFPDNEELRSSIHVGMSEEDLLIIYPIGNLKRYTRSGSSQIVTFNDILSSEHGDTVTFQLVDGKVKRWEQNSSAVTVDEFSKAKSDADKKISRPEITTAALAAAVEKEAMAERNKYRNPPQSFSKDEHDIMRMKQNERRSSIRSTNWYYNRGLYYR